MLKFIFKVILGLILLALLALVAFRIAAFMHESKPLETIRPSTGRVIQTRMGDIFVTETGTPNAPPVLLMHGTMAWGGFWQETSDAIAKAGFQAVAMDLPPFGFSDRDQAGDYSREKQAQRVLALAETFETKPILVAHSFGASVGLEAILQTPDQFSGLVVVSGAIGLRSHINRKEKLPLALRNQTIREFLVSSTATNPLLTKYLLSLFLYRKDQAKDKYVDTLQKPSALIGSTSAMASWIPYLLIPPADAKSTRPEAYETLNLKNTALIWGDKDTVSPLDQGRELNTLIKGSNLYILKNVGHIPQIEAPKEFQNLLIPALKKISSGAD
jgi:pimeloyl-ACP methyl ester carboxylesterase